MGRYHEAFGALDQYVDSVPSFKDATLFRAQLLFQMGQRVRAMRLVKTELEDDPDNVRLQALFRTLRASGAPHERRHQDAVSWP